MHNVAEPADLSALETTAKRLDRRLRLLTWIPQAMRTLGGKALSREWSHYRKQMMGTSSRRYSLG
jgi:D-alanyl-D-alanine dipeptidase